MVNFESNSLSAAANKEQLALDSEELVKMGDQFPNPSSAILKPSMEERSLQSPEEENAVTQVDFNLADLNIEDDGLELEEITKEEAAKIEEEKAVELDSSLLEEEVEDVEEIELSVEDMEEVFEEKNIESSISHLGEFVESFGEDGPIRAEKHLGTLYDSSERAEKKNIEDAVAFNRAENLIALGDGMGGMGSGDKAAAAFKEGFENLVLGDLSQMSESEIKSKITAELLNVSENIQEGGITCSMIKFFKDAEGNNKAVVVNVGDSAIYHKDTEGKFAELGEGVSLWSQLQEQKGNIFDSPDDWGGLINGFAAYKRRSGYPNIGEYFKKHSNAPELQALRETFDMQLLLDYVDKDPDLKDEEKKTFVSVCKNVNRVSPEAFTKNKDTGEIYMNESKVKIIDVNPGDRFFLASDGIVDNFSNEEIEMMMQNDLSSVEGNQAIKSYIDENIKGKSYYKQDDYSYVPIEFTA